MANYPKRKPKKESKEHDTIMAELDLFNEWKRTILPELRSMLLKGASAKEILSKYQAHAAARLVTTVITDPDAGKAMAAAKDVIDRIQGKSVERKEITHAMAQLSDEQLDALLKTELDDIEDETKQLN